jgi:hypothetical protein
MQDISRVEITGNSTATACNITCEGRTPILKLCRALLRKAYDPSLSLRCYRGDVLALTIRTIGNGAKLTVKEDIPGRPPHFGIYRAQEVAAETNGRSIADEAAE